jgi:vacuolar-type H+-ATPase subunit H
MEIIKRIKEAKTQTREIIEQAKSEAAQKTERDNTTRLMKIADIIRR